MQCNSILFTLHFVCLLHTAQVNLVYITFCLFVCLLHTAQVNLIYITFCLFVYYQCKSILFTFVCLFVYYIQRKTSRTLQRLRRESIQLSNPAKLSVCLGGYDVSLETEQCYLNHCGMVHLIVKLFMTTPSHDVFLEVVQLAVAILNGGNADVQVSF